MIEKLKPHPWTDPNGVVYGEIQPDNREMTEKINELVDAVNGILAAQEQYATIYKEDIVPMLTPKNEEPADPYAEQRKYLCKLCWFWNENYEDGVIGVLTGVFDEADRPFERNIDQTLYKHCEPVKPDDDIIYKGE